MILRGGTASKARPRFWQSGGIPVTTQGPAAKAATKDWTRPILVACLVGATLLLYLQRAPGPWRRSAFAPQEKQFPNLQEQTRVIEEIYAARRVDEQEALKKLGAGAFSLSPWQLGDRQQKGSLVWDYFQPSYNCPSRELVGKAGAESGLPVWLCGIRTLLQDPACNIYSFGASSDGSFEQALKRQTRCQVHVFDPLLSFQQQLRLEKVGGLAFLGYGIGPSDGSLSLQDPRQANPATNTSRYQAKSLASIMLDLQHEWVDVVILHVGGAEWSVLSAWLSAYKGSLLPFTQLSVKLHWWPESPLTKGSSVMLGVLEGLLSANLRPFAATVAAGPPASAASEATYSFIQVGANGRYIMPEDSDQP